MNKIQKKIPIVYITEESNIKLLSTSIVSLLENTKKTVYYNIYIFSNNIFSQSNIEKIVDYKNKYTNTSISFESFKMKRNLDFIEISNIISRKITNFTKCIYLNFDVIVQKDLSELYDIEIQDNQIGAIKEINDLNHNVFSKSVLLISISKQIKSSKESDFISLPLKYNLNALYFNEEKTFNFNKTIKMNPKLPKYFPPNEIKTAITDNVIFSYCDGINPLTNSECSFSYLWWKYFRLTNFVKIEKNYHNNPKVSVIIPIYNVQNYLKECLDSVVNQTLEEIEIICINDGSTDDSLSILEKYSEIDKRIVILEQENQGAGVARNAGLEIALGDYISFLDPDDFFELTMLEQAYNQSKTDNDIDIVVFDYSMFNEKMNKFFDCKIKIPKIEGVFSYKDITDTIFLTLKDQAWNKLFRRNFIKENNIKFQNLYRCNDLYFTNSALVCANKISILNKNLVVYRRNVSNSSQSTLYKYPLSFYYAELALRDKLIELGIYDDVEKGFLIKVLTDTFDNIRRNKNLNAMSTIYQHIIENIDNDFSIDSKAKFYQLNSLHDEFILIANTPFEGYVAIKGF